MFERYYNENLQSTLRSHRSIVADTSLVFDPPKLFEQISSEVVKHTSIVDDIANGVEKKILVIDKDGTVTVKFIEAISFKLRYSFHFSVEKTQKYIEKYIKIHIYAFNKFCGMHIEEVLGFEEYSFISGHIYYYKNSLELIKALEKLKKMDEKEKFDVVIGNPPYQNPNSNQKAFKPWAEFTILSKKLVKNQGYVSLVIPPSWIFNTTEKLSEKKGNARKIRQELISQGTLLFAEIQTINKYFKETIDFSYFIFKNSKNTSNVKTKFKTLDFNDEVCEFDLEYNEDIYMLPKVINEMTISILNKTVFNKNIKKLEF
jgi:hypothetical protein